MTYGKGPECQFLKSTFCPLLGVLTYFSIKFGSSIGIGKRNVSDLKFCNFDAFSLVCMRIYSRRNGKAEALIFLMLLSS